MKFLGTLLFWAILLPYAMIRALTCQLVRSCTKPLAKSATEYVLSCRSKAPYVSCKSREIINLKPPPELQRHQKPLNIYI